MLIKFHEDFRKFTDGLSELEIKGPTVACCIDRLFNRFPQLAVFLLKNEGEEGKKSSLLLNATTYLWTPEDCELKCTNADVLELGRDIPTGSGSIGKLIAGIVLIVVGVVMNAYVPGSGNALIGAGIGLAVGGVAGLIMGAPKLPKNDGVSDSPSYSFEGVQNTTNEGTPVGIVYGEHKVGGHFLNIYTDVDGSDNYLYAQLGICEGEIESISNVKLNDRDAAYFGEAVEIKTALGTKDQGVMSWFNRVENTTSLNLPAVLQDGQVVSTDDEVDAVKVTVKCPAIMYIHPKKGARTATVQYKVEYRVQGSSDPWTRYCFTYKKAGASEYTYRWTFGFTGKTQSEKYNEHLIEFPSPGAYEVKVTRITDERSSMEYTDDFYFSALNKLNYAKFAYPHTALLGIKVKATSQLSGNMPKVTSVVKGMKIQVPSNYNPTMRTYSGDWDGTLAPVKVYSNNPAWCMYDLLLNRRYGIGRYVNMSNDQHGKLLAQLYIMGQYCDAILDDGEPRFQLDLVIDSAAAAFEWLGIMAAIMRASLFYTEGRMNLDIDRQKPMTHIFNMSNIVKGSFTQQGASYKDVPNVYEVQFYDRDSDYADKVFRLEDTEIQGDYSIEEKKKALNLKGCTRRNQAKRLARFAALAGRQCTKTVMFKAGVESINCGVGSVIGVQHDVPEWGFGGRVASFDYDVSEVTLSSEVTLIENMDYTLKIQQGTSTTEHTVYNAPGTYTVLSVSSIPVDLEIGAIAVVGETSYEIKPFKVLSVRRDSNELAEIVATEYNDTLYAAAEDLTGMTEVVVHDFSQLQDPTDVSVSDVKLVERIYSAGDGTIVTGIDVSYAIPLGSSFWAGATIHYGPVGSGAPFTTPVDFTGTVFLPSLQEQQEYEVVVASSYKSGTSQSVEQARDAGAVATLYLLGKTKPPEPIANFAVAQDPWNNNFLKFTWEPGQDIYGNLDPDLSHYELRKGADWDTAEVIATLVREKYYNEYYIPESGSYTFCIKAVDTSGNYSSDAVSAALIATVEPADVTGLRAAQLGDEVLLTWNLSEDRDVLGYEVRRGVSWDTGAVVSPMVQSTFLRVSGLVAGTMRFMVKAVDRYSNYSVNATQTDVNVTGLTAQNIVKSFDEVALSWDGNHAGTVNVGGALSLSTAYVWDEGQTWDSGLDWDDTALGDGVYETTVYDIGSYVNCKVILEYEADLALGNSVQIEMRHSETGLADDWSDYLSFYGGYVTARYVQYRLTLSSVGGSIQVTKLATHYDVPETTYKGSATVTDTTNGVTVTFAEPYIQVPTVSLTSSGGLVLPNLEAVDEYGFTVKTYNLSGTSITGSFTWASSGY